MKTSYVDRLFDFDFISKIKNILEGISINHIFKPKIKYSIIEEPNCKKCLLFKLCHSRNSNSDIVYSSKIIRIRIDENTTLRITKTYANKEKKPIIIIPINESKNKRTKKPFWTSISCGNK